MESFKAVDGDVYDRNWYEVQSKNDSSSLQLMVLTFGFKMPLIVCCFRLKFDRALEEMKHASGQRTRSTCSDVLLTWPRKLKEASHFEGKTEAGLGPPV